MEFRLSELWKWYKDSNPGHGFMGSNPVQAWIFFMHYFHNRLNCAHNCDDQSYSHNILHILHLYSSPSTGILWSRKKLGHPPAKTGSYLAVSFHLPAATPPSDCPCLLAVSLNQCHPDISRPASPAEGGDLWPGMVAVVHDLHFSS